VGSGSERAFAESEISSQWMNVSQNSEITPWRIFGGITTGLGKVIGQDYQSAPGGGLIGVDLLGSYEWSRWVADAGIGWMYSSVNGQDSLGREIRIRTRSATAEFSPRYRLGQFWQVGPAVEMLFGADTAFGPSVGNSVGSAYAGLRVVYETASQSLPLRFLVQGLTDLNVPGRQVNLVTAGFQIGIPIRVARDGSSMPHHKTDVLSVSHSAPIRLVLDPQKVFFGTNSSKLKEPIQEALGQIGDFLAKHPDQWGRVEVSGHADIRGSYQYNLKLSKKRAQSVQSALSASNQIKSQFSDRVKSEGFSYSKPEDPANNPKAWARNRRVEVVFYDVRDPEELIRLIRELPLGAVAQQGESK
jgi:outer membrane protein OmpA-like peptidoglycan-associated protein